MIKRDKFQILIHLFHKLPDTAGDNHRHFFSRFSDDFRNQTPVRLILTSLGRNQKKKIREELKGLTDVDRRRPKMTTEEQERSTSSTIIRYVSHERLYSYTYTSYEGPGVAAAV